MSESTHTFFATCPKGVEYLLTGELTELGGTAVRETQAGVHFDGDLDLAYRVCLWSRLASRVLLPLATFPAPNADTMYEGVRRMDWLAHLGPDDTLAVDFNGTSAAIVHTGFGAQRVKDGVVDHVRDLTGRRPSVDRQNPAIRLNAHLHRDTLTLSLDLSGDGLHRRGYRMAGGEAPLKENLAAAILVRAGWPDICRSGGGLLDPLCGSGTLLIEAALMAADVAPGLLRNHFGFMGWRRHRHGVWMHLLAEARDRRARGLQRKLPPIMGRDADAQVVVAARSNIRRAGMERVIEVEVAELAALHRPRDMAGRTGLLVTNPPYGARMGDTRTLAPLYRSLGHRLREEFTGWRAAVFTGNPELGKTMGLRADHQYRLYNGSIPCRLLLFGVEPGNFVNRPHDAAAAPAGKAPAAASPRVAPVVASSVEMFRNRLVKNKRNLGRWARREGLTCYRLYDADMPEFSLAVDLYGERVHVQEYAPPSTVDARRATQRLEGAMSVIADVLEVPPERMSLKQRVRQRGSGQYRRQADRGQFLEVEEYGCRFLVNLTDYLDTGLFLDSRPIRRRIREQGAERFLNLFCYTATATVCAAAGGARESLGVDMSGTYLEWTRRNLNLNGLSESRHQLERADCLTWLKSCRRRFDLILLDPPTFSNSKRMREVLDVQRDHPDLIRSAARLLAPDGLILFCCNLRRFKMDEASLAGLELHDISAATIDPDFARRPRIHHCWEIRPRRS